MPRPSVATEPSPAGRHPWRHRLLARYRWLPFVAPLGAYMLLASCEPAPTSAAGLAYPLAYALRIAATCGVVLFVWPAVRRVPLHVSAWAMPVGMVGVVLWIGLAKLALAQRLLEVLGWEPWATAGARTAFDPFTALETGSPALALFLALRFAGLVAVVPLVEELFLRGFWMRFCTQATWWEVELGKVTAAATAGVAAYAALSHPTEPVAAVVWFSLVTALYAKTRNFWDCVVAHAVTNGLLGLYILIWQDWRLW